MKTKQKKDYYILRMLLFFTLSLPSFALSSQTIIKGTIQDAQTKEALIGATITIKGQTKGTTTNVDGFYELELSPGKHQFLISYLSYKSIVTNEITIQKGETKELNLLMEEDNHFLDEINVVAKKNREAENILITERKNSTLAIENLGAREMSVKGLSTVADGIKKITGISMEGKSQVIVRGLGDRYNMTSLNGFPIASPNPDNKLIP
ncbi:MAG: carboxypeptidase-like regulatory domain-containing protein, partial [Bacteroides sp.]|nr:carboxypeptidase-like regulatory domain-containing protein [Bacteroides sp.]